MNTVEADVVVVGMGCAGAAAAHEAARAGAQVVVLEGAGGPGGTSALSGGELYLGGGTSVQKACGFDDDPDQMYAYLVAALGPGADAAKIRLYCDESVEHFTWFESLGIEFRSTLYDGVSWLPPTDDGLMWLGENAWPFTELARPAPRGHRPATEGMGGWLLMDKLAAAAQAAGARVEANASVHTLLVDDGRVSGVIARRFGEELGFRARRGVVLATGGFADDAAMVADHLPVLEGHGRVSGGRDDGSGIRLALAAGAASRLLGSAQIALSIVPALACRGLIVDGLGQRFINEDVYPGRFSQAAVRHRPGPYFTVVDERGWEEVPAAERWGVVPHTVAATCAEIEAEVGLPAGALEDTIARYNRDAAAGTDLLHHKDPRWLRPLEPPYAVIEASAGFDPDGRGGRGGTGVSGFTLGGLRTGLDGEVLGHDGLAIPGLFAAGRATSGLHGEGYVSGTSLGDGTFFGRRAGRAVACS